MEQKSLNILNKEEFELVGDARYPLIKKGAMEKIRAQLHDLGKQLMHRFPGHSYKISSGENYRNYPYLVLDFPKISGPGFPFLMRTLWWWGHPVSFQVFMRRDREWEPQILPKLLNEKIFVLTGPDLWENDTTAGAYQLFSGTIPPLGQEEYIKLIRLAENKKPGDLFEEASGFFELFGELLQSAS